VVVVVVLERDLGSLEKFCAARSKLPEDRSDCLSSSSALGWCGLAPDASRSNSESLRNVLQLADLSYPRLMTLSPLMAFCMLRSFWSLAAGISTDCFRAIVGRELREGCVHISGGTDPLRG
jgi:hypothetical protein